MFRNKGVVNHDVCMMCGAKLLMQDREDEIGMQGTTQAVHIFFFFFFGQAVY
jgi:hypothetical protein